MGFGGTPILDTFNRANGAIGANWTADPFGFGNPAGLIAANLYSADQSFTEQWWNVSTFGPSIEAYITITTLPVSAQGVGLDICMQTPGSAAADGYEVFLKRNTNATTDWEIHWYEVLNQGYTLAQQTTGITFAIGDTFGVAKVGSALTAWRRTSGGVLTILDTWADATYSTGYIGLYTENATAGNKITLNDFGGGTFVASDVMMMAPRMPQAILAR